MSRGRVTRLLFPPVEEQSPSFKAEDEGRGIEPERLEPIFEPDFRAEDGRVVTTNWGLFVSRTIMTEHGGRLEIESTPGTETTATMRIPT